MATGQTPNCCSMCKNDGKNNCTGCQKFFCVKDYTKHRQQLSLEFDSDVGRTHDELLEQIHRTKGPNYSADDLFLQIDRWEKATIEKIHEAAENVRHQLTEIITSDREVLTKQFENLTKEVRHRREEEDFDETNIEDLQRQIDQLQKSFAQLNQPNKNKVIVVENDEIDWSRIIYAKKSTATRYIDILPDAKWTQNGITVAGGHQKGSGLNQLSRPTVLYVDDDQTVYVADQWNHRVVEWKCRATIGQVVAGGNGKGDRIDQLNQPSNVIVDKQTDSLIIYDYGNRRVVRWPRRGAKIGETIISNVSSYGLTMDDGGYLYVSDWQKHEVRRWRTGGSRGTLVAGGNGQGERLDQLNGPTYIFVDGDRSVYVSDSRNHRVMKWVKDAKEGIVVAGGQGQGNALTQFNYPRGVLVDRLGAVYVADRDNHRIMRWSRGATQGSVVIGGSGAGVLENQLSCPIGLSFDADGNLYVVDEDNHRVQKFFVKVVLFVVGRS